MTHESHPPTPTCAPNDPPHTTRCTDWYAEGESRVVVVGDVWIIVTFMGQKGRRGRVQIEAPAGAEFVDV